MSGILRLKGASSGYVEFSAPDSGANTTVNAGLLVYKDSANGTITGVSTNDIPEGSNLYYTTARFDSDFGTKDISSYDSALVQGQFDSALPVALASDVSLGNITTTGYLRGPSTFVVDPATHGDDTGTLRVAGNLTVDGTTTTINSTTVTTADKNIVIAQGAADSAAADGAGITVDTVNASLSYSTNDDRWEFDRHLFINTNTENELYGPAAGGSWGISINDNATDSDSICSLKFNSTDAGGNNRHFASIAAQKTGQWADAGGNYPGALTFWTRPTSGNQAERMRIDKDGNVGIGTTAPNRKLTINQTPPTAFGSPMLQVGEATFVASGYYGIGLGYTAASYTNPPTEIAAVSTSSSGGTTADIVFGTRSVTTNTAVTERMRIKSDGKVRVNTDNANAVGMFQVKQGTNANLVISNVGTGGIGIAGINDLASSNVPLGYNASQHEFQTDGTDRMLINNSGDLIPGANGTQDIGSSSLRWGTVYTSDLSLKNENGDWTIVEGEDDLFLYNNKKGKVYKFALTEVDPDTAPAKRD